mgnify:CR=1 FL=1
MWRNARGSHWSRHDRPIRTGRRDRPVIHLPSVPLRVMIVAGAAVLLFGVIFFRLWFLQILSSESFLAQANDNRLRSVKIEAPRGSIQDRNGEVLVENRAGLAVGVRLVDVPEGELTGLVTRLAKALKMSKKTIRETLEDKGDASLEDLDSKQAPIGIGLIVIKSDVGRNKVSYLLEHKLSFPGVEIRKTYLRDYPLGSLAAHVLGYVREISAEQLEEQRYKDYSAGDVIGQEGLEWTYDRWLRGKDGVAKVEVDVLGRPKSSAAAGGRLAEPGDTLVTTIDADVQKATEESLRYAISLAHETGNWGANGGAAVVLDARNGEVLSMASYPTYNPSVWVGGISAKDFKRLNDRTTNYPQINRAISTARAVGSTFKAITAVAALEEGIIEPSTSFYCDGSYIVPIDKNKTPYGCWLQGGHGTLNLIGALTQSCDVYFYNVGYLIYQREDAPLADWAGRLGFGKDTGVDIPGEVKGLVPTKEWRKSHFKSAVDQNWSPGHSLLLAIGQGDLQATPLQLAVAYAAIANGGTIVTPHLGMKVVDSTGRTVQDLDPGTAGHVDITKGTLDAVRAGLRSAASASTGTSAAVFAGYPIKVAGKTGTAEVWDDSSKSYVNYAWYASYAPYDNPKYVTVMMIEKGGHGGSVAAPATRLIYDALFGIKGERAEGAKGTD